MIEYEYQVHFEGSLRICSEEKLSEEELTEMSEDIISGDAWTRLHNDCSVDLIEIIDENEREY